MIRLGTYEQADKWFKRVKTPSKGRPLGTSVRLFKLGDTYEFRIHGTPFLHYHRDNTATVPISMDDARKMSACLAIGMHRYTPFTWRRVNTGVWAVQHTRDYSPVEPILRSKEPLLFDLSTGKCLNAEIRPAVRIDSVKRSKWLADNRRFRFDMRVREKMGVYTAEHAANIFSRTSISYRTDLVPVLARALTDSDYSDEFIAKVYAERYRYGYQFRTLTPPKWGFSELAIRLVKSYSRALRAHLGVIS